MKTTSTSGLAFWSPLILPVLLGLMAGFVGLVGAFSETGTMVLGGSTGGYVSAEDLKDWLKVDLLSLWHESVVGLAFSLFAVHIWSLTTLFSTKVGSLANAVFYYPILGLLTHLILAMVVVSVSSLEESFSRAGALSRLNVGVVAEVEQILDADQDFDEDFRALLQGIVATSDSEPPADLEAAELAARFVSTAAILLALLVAWLVRKGVWSHCDSLEEGAGVGDGVSDLTEEGREDSGREPGGRRSDVRGWLRGLAGRRR